jgi:hypothetical protein
MITSHNSIGALALGNGEVDSSILSGSTIPPNKIIGSRKTNWPLVNGFAVARKTQNVVRSLRKDTHWGRAFG